MTSTEQSKFMLIDLSSGELSPLLERDFHVGSDLETPWKEAVRLREGELRADEVLKPQPRAGLVVLALPLTIGRGSYTVRWQWPVYEAPPKIEKASLTP